MGITERVCKMWRLFFGICICAVMVIADQSFAQTFAQTAGCMQNKIASAYHFCHVSNRVDAVKFETQMLALLDDDHAMHAQAGMIYKTIADEFSRDVTLYASNVIKYAQLAISNNIDVVDTCKMYIRMADAGKVAICQDRDKEEYVRQSQAVPILKGLSLALGSLKSTRYEMPPAVNKYDVDDNSQHSEAIYSAHRQQLLANDRAVKQNQLLMLCIVMSQKIAQLYGPDFPSNPNFLCAVKEVASSPDEVELIVGKVRFFVDNGMDVFSSREF